jgi:hypothetical protein
MQNLNQYTYRSIVFAGYECLQIRASHSKTNATGRRNIEKNVEIFYRNNDDDDRRSKDLSEANEYRNVGLGT